MSVFSAKYSEIYDLTYSKKIKKGELIIERDLEPSFEGQCNTYNVRYDLTISGRSVGKKKFSETHATRHFFPDEIEFLLKLSGFKLISLHSFLHSEAKVKRSDWVA